MNKIDYQALREAAEKATWGDWDSYKPHRGARGYEVRLSSQAIAQHVLKNNAEFIAAFNPKIALALLDERERNQQYIKSRDQENEDIALTVGKLRVELEGKDSKIANLTAERDALREGEMGDARHSNTRAAADIYFQLVEECEIPAGGSLVEYVDDMREKLEAAENNLIDSECHVAELEEALRDKQALLEASEKRIAELEAELVSQTYKLNELSGNSPVIPGEVLSAILKVARVRADFDDFDGDRRGIGDCLDEAEQELIVTINKYASQLAAGPIAPNDVREQTAVPPVPVIQADVAQAIEKLKRKLVECNRYNYCADAVKGVEYACHAAMLQGSQPVSQTYKFPVNTPCQDAPAHIWLQTAGVWPEDGELSELTWCSHNQHHDDTLYVRADLVNGNSPVTPDGWISCSERMPDTKTAVLVAREFDRKGDWRMKWATYIPGHPDSNDGWIIPGASWIPSHWMPLPEPPQEVK